MQYEKKKLDVFVNGFKIESDTKNDLHLLADLEDRNLQDIIRRACRFYLLDPEVKKKLDSAKNS